MRLPKLSLFVPAVIAFVSVETVAAKDFQLVPQTTIAAIDGIADQTQGTIKWSHGAFLYVNTRNGGVAPTFYTLDRGGKVVSSATAVLPNLSGIVVSGFDRSASGAITFSGQSQSQYGDAIPFIAFMTSEGQTSQVIFTAPYFPHSLSVAPDGTVWTLGYEMIHHNTKAEELNPDAGVLRHFDAAGKFLAWALPQSGFRHPDQCRLLAFGRLAVTKDSVGWTSAFLGKSEYVELSPETMKIVHEYPGVPVIGKQGFIGAFALTDSGEAIATFEDQTPERKSVRRPSFVFDRQSQSWVEIPITPFGSKFPPRLSGSDGDQLVFLDGDAAGFFSVKQ